MEGEGGQSMHLCALDSLILNTGQEDRVLGMCSSTLRARTWPTSWSALSTLSSTSSCIVRIRCLVCVTSPSTAASQSLFLCMVR
eukprot:scaffold88631_cov21-Tisochrysis_lutea.AAC.2